MFWDVARVSLGGPWSREKSARLVAPHTLGERHVGVIRFSPGRLLSAGSSEEGHVTAVDSKFPGDPFLHLRFIVFRS